MSYSHRELQELLDKRGVNFDHTTFIACSSATFLRESELLRLITGYIAAQADDIVKDYGSIIPAGTLCYLHIPAGKTSKAFLKPVAAVM